LRAFRGDHHKTPLRLHRLEKALVIVVGVHLCFLPWALGTMHVWSQLLSGAFAVTAFVLALWPRNYTSENAREGSFRLLMWPRLRSFPLTWIGLLFLGYVAFQAANPAWEFFRFPNGSWTMRPLASIPWLPHGMRTPFSMMNPWRVLIIYSSAWFLMCALWVGITRRIALQTLVTIIVVNGTILAVFGLLQRLAGPRTMFWGLLDRSGSFFATIIYKNHAGAYFNLVLGIAAAAFIYCIARQARRMERSNPGPFFAFCCFILAFAVLLTYSRAASLLMGAFLVFCFFGFGRQLFFAKDRVHNRWVMGLLGVVFAIFLLLGVKALDLKTSADRVGTLFSANPDFSITSRQQVLQAGWNMAKQDLITGWGAGGFRFRFPSYQQNFPGIWQQGGRRLLWEQAHNDYIQTLIEFGVLGSGILVLGLIYCLFKFGKHRGWSQLHAVTLLLGLAITLAHGWADFPFQNPAILLTWCGTFILLLRWIEIEDKKIG
jgi:O-antigen ligase